MKQWFIFLGISIFTLACGNLGEGGQLAVNARGEKAEAKPDGEKTYKQYCVTCHGINGDMGASGAFNLRKSQLGLEERLVVITGGRNAMPPFETLLSKKEIKAVAGFTLTLQEE
ncbi:MAG: cytochrome c [Lewinellaceae bacterium]|nr:cytochrome c [Lewinellaceae bacterium]MCB9287978.1 cytochrome c [Lewinellaceae bacterium]